MRLNTNTPGSSARRAFTLVELMLVISIIALLTALLVAGAMKFKDAARTNAVDAQVAKYQRALDSEYNLVVKQATKDAPPAGVLTACNNDVDRARAVHLAATLKINFPETFAEAETGSSFNIGGQQYTVKNTFASVRGIPAASAPSAEMQRAILLYLIIKERATAGTGDDTEAAGEQATVQVGSKSFNYFVDNYGQPLIYYRWTQNAEVNQPPYTAQTPISKDPLDPKNLVATWNNASTLNAAPYSLGFNSSNRLPTVVSAGKNKTLENFGGDDRVGYRLARFGAQGDGQ